jgi:hypothetical protein
MAAIVGSTVALSCASLVPATFGMPTIVQSGSTTAFNQDTASAADLESINIGFPMFDGIQDASSTGFATAPDIGGLNMFRSSLSAPFSTSFGPSVLQAGSLFNMPSLF